MPALLASASRYVDARWRIALLEGHEAARAGMRMLMLGLVGFMGLVMAYAGMMVAAAWWLADLWKGGAAGVVTAFVLGHLLLAALCAVWLARSVRRGRFFHATRKEFMEDKRWLEAHHPFRS